MATVCSLSNGGYLIRNSDLVFCKYYFIKSLRNIIACNVPCNFVVPLREKLQESWLNVTALGVKRIKCLIVAKSSSIFSLATMAICSTSRCLNYSPGQKTIIN